MSGFAGLLRRSGKAKHSGSHDEAEDIYSNVMRRELPPESQIIFDGELKLLLMDGCVFPANATTMRPDLYTPLEFFDH